MVCSYDYPTHLKNPFQLQHQVIRSQITEQKYIVSCLVLLGMQIDPIQATGNRMQITTCLERNLKGSIPQFTQYKRNMTNWNLKHFMNPILSGRREAKNYKIRLHELDHEQSTWDDTIQFSLQVMVIVLYVMSTRIGLKLQYIIFLLTGPIHFRHKKDSKMLVDDSNQYRCPQ